MDILGVRIDNLNRKEILQRVEDFLLEEKFHQIATVNPEFVLQALIDTNFRRLLNRCNFNIADGIGIKFAFWRYGKHLKRRIAGVDLMHDILRIADKQKMSVFLAASTRGLSTWQQTAAALGILYPNVRFSGDNIDPFDVDYILETGGYDVLLCNFGAPHQEHFINSVKNDTIRLAMGVGGAFDFVTGKTCRAPRLWRKLGFEWLWRFIQEPGYRAKRIFNAVVVFPIKIIFKKMNGTIEVKIAQDQHQLDAAMEIRKKVLQEEQGIDKSLDFDGKDEHSDHFIAYMEKSVIGTGRIRYSFDGRKIAKVERMAVLKEFRGQGVGRQIIEAMHDYLKSKDVSDIKLDSPEGVKGFYEKMGYEQKGDVFVEVGQPYVQMIKQL